MKVLTAAEMAATDRRTVQAGIVSATLMENAGCAVARFALRQYPQAQSILVVCGKGNNGGDGSVAARLLAAAGKSVTVLLLAEASALQGDAAAMFAALNATPVEIVCATDEASLAATGLFDCCDLVIDAMFGTGFKPPLRGLAITVRDRLAACSASVVAVDLPSGWDADATEEKNVEAFRADTVVTFTAPKPAHLFGNLTGSTSKPVVVAEIGSPETDVISETQLFWAGSAKAVAEKPREVNSNKGRFGHVLVVGGALGKAGAPAMASLASLRTGAGLVTAGVPESIVSAVAAVTPELMTIPLDERKHTGTVGGTLSRRNMSRERMITLLDRKTVVALGPGLSTEPDAAMFARVLVEKTRMPLVLDADGLNAFAGQTQLLNGRERVLVLTPHPGEMARLLGLTVQAVEADRVNIARAFAMKHHVILVLKGWRTLIAHPSGRVAVNTSGNPAMAKGGSGDILTGIVAAMLAQYPERAAEAVEAAVYLHGLAADFAARAQDEHTVLATDTVAHLSDAFRYRMKDEDGFTWICGLRT
ncbi:MAG TPA: NAD(P)H-hydrate dehydratase [Acidobacteriaceae bacterium]|nr:NAD(P)H-hydrate dehydratase [Acidobacteriaceae bacterium]